MGAGSGLSVGRTRCENWTGGKGGVTDLEEAKSHDGGGECKKPQEPSRMMVVVGAEYLKSQVA